MKNPNSKTILNQKAKTACGNKTEVYSRVVGFFRPIANWNNGKKEEFNDRKEYIIKS